MEGPSEKEITQHHVEKHAFKIDLADDLCSAFFDARKELSENNQQQRKDHTNDHDPDRHGQFEITHIEVSK